MKDAMLWVGLILIAVAALDLLTGNTDKPILPEAIGNNLSQGTDLVIGAVGAGLIIFR